jgi:hypothetical protein
MPSKPDQSPLVGLFCCWFDSGVPVVTLRAIVLIRPERWVVSVPPGHPVLQIASVDREAQQSSTVGGRMDTSALVHQVGSASIGALIQLVATDHVQAIV